MSVKQHEKHLFGFVIWSSFHRVRVWGESWEEGSMGMLHLCMLGLNFILGLILIIFCFLFWGMIMYNNEFKTKEDNNWTKDKFNHNIYLWRLRLLIIMHKCGDEK